MHARSMGRKILLGLSEDESAVAVGMPCGGLRYAGIADPMHHNSLRGTWAGTYQRVRQ